MNTIPMQPMGPMRPTDAAAPPIGRAPADAARRGHVLPITFSGSGSEYFRIWIVNLLLTVVTLGLYFPWAKVRRLRYFYGNTHVGDHTLDFHGNPSRMLRGFLLVAALVVLYSVAGKISPTAGFVAFLIVAAIWPALFRAGQRFRLANTSWRGLRFRFVGTLADAYRAMLPLFVPSALLLGLIAVSVDENGAPTSGMAAWFGVAPVLILLLLPLFLWMIKKYQHDNLALGEERTTLHLSAGSFYRVFLKTVGISLMVGLVGFGAIAIVGGASAFALFSGRPRDPAVVASAMVALVVGLVLVYLAVIVVVRPYVTARMQNLVWNATRSLNVRFVSTLRFRALLGLTVKNWLLTIVTLGFYFPFASIAMARLRLEAASVEVRIDPDELESRVRERADDAAADAAGDLFGIDVGL